MLKDMLMTAVLPAEDLERATKFYQETLGLKLNMDGPGGKLFEAGNETTVLLYEYGPAEAGNTALGFNVEDLDAEMADLRNRGVVFEEYDLPNLKTDHGVMNWGPAGRSAWFKDSEGNIIALNQMS